MSKEAITDANGARLFISHHSSQAEAAEHVARALEARGVSTWLAPRDVKPGAAFDQAIRSGLEDSTSILVLFCAKADQSRHVKRELIIADEMGLPIIPVRLERVVPDGLSYWFKDAQWIDWLDRRDAVLDRIADSVKTRSETREFVRSSKPPQSNFPWKSTAAAGLLIAIVASAWIYVSTSPDRWQRAETARLENRLASLTDLEFGQMAGELVAGDAQMTTNGDLHTLSRLDYRPGDYGETLTLTLYRTPEAYEGPNAFDVLTLGQDYLRRQREARLRLCGAQVQMNLRISVTAADKGDRTAFASETRDTLIVCPDQRRFEVS